MAGWGAGLSSGGGWGGAPYPWGNNESRRPQASYILARGACCGCKGRALAEAKLFDQTWALTPLVDGEEDVADIYADGAL